MRTESQKESVLSIISPSRPQDPLHSLLFFLSLPGGLGGLPSAQTQDPAPTPSPNKPSHPEVTFVEFKLTEPGS